MTFDTHIKEPRDCDEDERRGFAQLVRKGFRASLETLAHRVITAECLAFHARPDSPMIAISALKSPSIEYRKDAFQKAGARNDPAKYEQELGWVYVLPDYRGHQIGQQLCSRLVERSPSSSLFATTRVENARMARILDSLDFHRVGQPYQRRNEVLVLYCRR